MKLRYRIIILVAVFVGALYFFGRDMDEFVFRVEAKTTEMAETTLPTLSMQVGTQEMNLLYGYTSNLNALLIRETITPLLSDQTVTILIRENESVVRKLKYEVYEVLTGALLEEGSVSALSTENDRKTVQLKLKAQMKEGEEYAIKLTLITDQSKRIYFYTRARLYTKGYLEETFGYAKFFHEAALDKARAVEIERNLETSAQADNTDFARVTIESDLDTVSWGELNPTVVYEQVPTITEFYNNMASMVLSFVVSIDTGTGVELYTVRECYRFQYTELRTYLYNFEREMEALFDVSRTSLQKSEFKLGITADTDIEVLTSAENAYYAFVHNRELWQYDKEANELRCVFSFRQENTDYVRDLHEDHEVRLLQMDDAGNLDFLVYGYMNRGEYEGRVGVLFYRYVKVDNRIEEKLYFPMNTTYQILKGELSRLVYLNQTQVLYFGIFATLYTYNLATETLSVLAEDVPEEHLVFLPELQIAAWQDSKRETEGKRITVMNLETSRATYIDAPQGQIIRLLGSIDSHLIYGLAQETDILRNIDGSSTVPMYQVNIATTEHTILKEYAKAGLYVVDVSVDENVVTLSRVRKSIGGELRYEAAETDAIQNRLTAQGTADFVTRRVTERMRTEYYLALPSGVKLTELPKTTVSRNTVITQDTTVRISEPTERDEQYYAYSFGRVVLVTETAADAIERANEAVGTVINSGGAIVWERGVKSARSEISDLTPFYVSDGMNSLQAALRMLYTYKGVDTETSGLSFEERSIGEWLEQYLKVDAVNLKGASLDEVLYFVYLKRPVIGMTNEGEALVLYGYDANSVSVVDPLLGKTRRIAREEAEELFMDGGNVFVSYIE